MSEIEIGKIFEQKFLILSQIGQGGMGQVFLAKNLEQERLVAIKTLVPKYDQDKEAVARFFREFKLLSTLRHESIVVVYFLSTDHQGNPFAVCEYIEGIDLRKLLAKRGPLPWRETLELIKQIAYALNFVHENGVVHHDIKPENILVIEENGVERAKLLDFGLSRLTDANVLEPKLTWTGQLLGSPQYMAPEQLSQRGDRRSDIHSLGSVTFELLSGEIPFNADTPLGVLWQKNNSAAETALSGLSTHVPGGLYLLLLKMLATDPRDRYQSMSELIEDIDQIIRNPGIEKAMSAWARDAGRKRVEYGKIASISFILILLIVTTGTVYIRWQKKTAKSTKVEDSISSLEAKAKSFLKSRDHENACRTYADIIALLRKDPKRMGSSYKILYSAVIYSAPYYHMHPSPELAQNILSYVDDFCRLAIQHKDSSLYAECATSGIEIAIDLNNANKIITDQIEQSSKAWGCSAPSTVELITQAILVFLQKGDKTAATAMLKHMDSCKENIDKNSLSHLKFISAKCRLEAATGKTSESIKDAEYIFSVFKSGDDFLNLTQKVELFCDMLERTMDMVNREDLYTENAIALLSSKRSEFDSDPRLGERLSNSIAQSYSATGNKAQEKKYRKIASEFAEKTRSMPKHKWLPHK